VVFERNIVRHSGGAVNILGVDNNHPSKQTRGIVIRSNVFADLDNQRWGGSGYSIQMSDGPRDVTFDHNTIIQEHGAGFIQVEGSPITGFVFTNNIVRSHTYGVAGRDHAPGNDSISFYFPGAKMTGNVIADADSARYPSGNQFPTFAELCAQMMSCESRDYRFKPEAKLRSAGPDVESR
jgi:hypothetical protein